MLRYASLNLLFFFCYGLLLLLSHNHPHTIRATLLLSLHYSCLFLIGTLRLFPFRSTTTLPGNSPSPVCRVSCPPHPTGNTRSLLHLYLSLLDSYSIKWQETIRMYLSKEYSRPVHSSLPSLEYLSYGLWSVCPFILA